MKTGTKVMLGHSLALVTSFVWGITFVSSRIVLDVYSPLELVAIRFTMAYLALWMIKPKFLAVKDFKSELMYVAAGATGVFGFFLMENTALLYTTVSNVGLLLASVPLFVAIVLHLFTHDEKFEIKFLYGFIIAMAGVALVIYNGQVNLQVNPYGDFLAVMAAVVWALYSLALKKIDITLSPVIVTRRVFFYGALFCNIALFSIEGGTSLKPMMQDGVIYHLLFLGLIGSGACYVLWNQAILWIGAVRTSNYIYLMPLFTMIASAIVLNETITKLMLLGCGFILAGVYVSENGWTLSGMRKKRTERS